MVVDGVSVVVQVVGVIHRNAPVVVHAVEVVQVALIPVPVQRRGQPAARVAPITEVVQRELLARAPARRHGRDRRLQAERKRQPRARLEAQRLRGTHLAANNAQRLQQTENRSGNSSQRTVR